MVVGAYLSKKKGGLYNTYHELLSEKWLHNAPGRPVISNSGYYTENISSFLDHHLQPLAQAVKSYIKDTNEFLKKLRSLPKLPDDIIFCTMDAVGLYPNIPHEEGLSALRKRLETRKEKYVPTDTIIDVAEVVLKNNIFTFGKKTLKQKRGTAVGTKFAPLYSILFMTELEEEIIIIVISIIIIIIDHVCYEA